MAIFQLEKMTWMEVERLEKAYTVLFLPISPIEEHGPHLPLGTDIFCARDIAAEAAHLITRQNPRIQAVLAPGIPLGCSSATADFPGTISVQKDTLKQVVSDVCCALAGHGFKYIVISNHRAISGPRAVHRQRSAGSILKNFQKALHKWPSV